MYYLPHVYPYPYFYNVHQPIYNPCSRQPIYWYFPNEIQNVGFDSFRSPSIDRSIPLRDYGAKPLVVNINEATKQNNTFRTSLWTGTYFQVTLMSLNVGEDIDLEMHSHVDQFLRVEQGQGIVKMGNHKDNLDFEQNIYDDSAIIVPAGTWHNIINTGNIPLKLYSIYAPPNHPFGTVHVTKADALAAEEHSSHGNANTMQMNEYRTQDFW